MKKLNKSAKYDILKTKINSIVEHYSKGDLMEYEKNELEAYKHIKEIIKDLDKK